ncbi:phage tail tape measure protein, partial [Enterococcus thailandicus]
KFATGGIHQGGLMLVNDGEGEELVRHPDGRMEIPKGKNVLMHAEAGTQVLNHSQTKSFAEAFGIPMYAKGNVSNLGDFFKSAWNGIKDIGSDILDAVQHPVEFVKKAISEHVNFDATHPVFDIATGGVKKVTNGVMDWIKDKIASFGSIGGSFDGAMADNVYKYLVDIANQTVSKFGMSGITSGYRPGDPYYHGKHQAIDIAYPAGMNGSSKYFDPANWVFEHFADKVGYVITQGKVRDRTGQSGQPATGEWEPWPDNDHYDHLHITGKLGSGDIYKAGEGGGKGSPTGSGVARWTSQLKEALRMNGLPTNASYINAWLRQIETESGGNERAVQGGYTDINSISGDLAKGLLQTITATFNAFKFPGHGNIFNGFDNMLAAINYAKTRYGSSMLSVIGNGHGYSNGGEVFGPELAMFGEDPAYPYEININPAKPSADMLIQKAIVARERYKPAVQANQAVYSNQHSNGGNEHKTLSKKDIETIVQALNERPVRVESILDGEKVSKNFDERGGSELTKKMYMGGGLSFGK